MEENPKKPEITERTERPLLVTIPEWNRDLHNHYDMVKKLHDNKIILICPICASTTKDQAHVDTSSYPYRRQVTCDNPECDYVDYRSE